MLNLDREGIARALFANDEAYGPIRMNVGFGHLKGFQQSQYYRYADALLAAAPALPPVPEIEALVDEEPSNES